VLGGAWWGVGADCGTVADLEDIEGRRVVAAGLHHQVLGPLGA